MLVGLVALAQARRVPTRQVLQVLLLVFLLLLLLLLLPSIDGILRRAAHLSLFEKIVIFILLVFFWSW